MVLIDGTHTPESYYDSRGDVEQLTMFYCMRCDEIYLGAMDQFMKWRDMICADCDRKQKKQHDEGFKRWWSGLFKKYQ